MWVIQNIKTKKYACTKGMSKDINKASTYEIYHHAIRDCDKDEKVLKVRINLWRNNEK